MAKKIFLGLLVALLASLGNQASAGYKIHKIGQGYNFNLNQQGKIVFERWIGDPYPDGNDEIFLYDLKVRSTKQITQTGFDNYEPAINAFDDTAWLGLNKAGSGKAEVYWCSAGGSPVAITKDSAYDNNNVFLSDDGKIVWDRSNGTHYQIFAWDGQKTVQLTNEPFDHWEPRLSPNGRFVVYAALPETGKGSEIFRYNFQTGVMERITNDATNDLGPEVNDAGDIKWTKPQGQSGSTSYYYLLRHKNAIGGNEVVAQDVFSPGNINFSGAVTWSGITKYGYRIFYNLVTTTQLVSRSGTWPQLDDRGRIVFERQTEYHGPSRVMTYKGGSIFQVSPDDGFSHFWPQTNNHGDIAWVVWDNNHYLIYAATFTDSAAAARNLLLLQ